MGRHELGRESIDEARLKRGFSMPEKEIVPTPHHPA